MSDDIRLDLLRDAIAESGLDGQTKDVLADDLKYAQDINGTKDPALQGIKRLVISGVRRELLAHDRTIKAVDDHEQNCARRIAALAVPTATGGDGRVMRWFAVLLPFRWPIAVICFSPFAGDIIGRVLQSLGR